MSSQSLYHGFSSNGMMQVAPLEIEGTHHYWAFLWPALLWILDEPLLMRCLLLCLLCLLCYIRSSCVCSVLRFCIDLPICCPALAFLNSG